MVEELEENELFEQTMLRGSQAGLEEYAMPKDIDPMMRSMMGYPSSDDSSVNATVTIGPWNQTTDQYQGESTPSRTGGFTEQKRTKGKVKSRK